jgi:hypothetical protein
MSRPLKRASHALVALVLTLLVPSVADAKGPYGSIKVGMWAGGAYTNDATGAFSHCAAGAPYLSGILLIVGMDARGGWSLGFAHQAWQLTPGEVIAIDLTFDGHSQFHVFGTAQTPVNVLVPMPNSSALLAAFRKSATMAAVAKGNLFQFNLNETSQLLPALANCVAIVSKRGIAAAGDFTVRSVPRPAPNELVAPVPSTLRPVQPAPNPADFQIEAMELATNFILKSALQNPRVLGRAETPAGLASDGAAWRAQEASGTVKIIPPQPDMKGIDVAAALAAADAKECKGKFLSGRVSELVDSEVVFRGFATCDDSDGPRAAEYFIVPRKKGGFVMFSVVSDMKTEQSRKIVGDEKLVDFRKAALTAVSYNP